MSNTITKAAIVGASGYAGAELIRIIHAHPYFELGALAAGANAGAKLTDVHPQFSSVAELASKVFVASTPAELAGHDLVFLALKNFINSCQHNWNSGCTNTNEHDDIEVLTNDRNIAEEISCNHQSKYPKRSPSDIEELKA